MKFDVDITAEMIKCPACDIVQAAIFEHTVPFGTYVHECVNCKYVIMESEWTSIKPFKQETAPTLSKGEGKEDWEAQAKALSAIKKGLEKSLSQAYNRIRKLESKDDWKSCRCDVQYHWCFVHNQWGKADPPPPTSQPEGVSAEEMKLNILIDAGQGHLFSLHERKIIFEAMEKYALSLIEQKSIFIEKLKQDIYDFYNEKHEFEKQLKEKEAEIEFLNRNSDELMENLAKYKGI